MHDLDFFLRAAAISQLMLIAVVLLRDHPERQTGVLGGLFFLAAVAHLLDPLIASVALPVVVTIPIFILDVSAPVFFWLFSRALFSSSFKFGLRHLALITFVTAYSGFVQVLLPQLEMASSVYSAAAATGSSISLAIVVIAIVQAYAGRTTDVVEDRRRLREIFVALTGGYILLVAGVEIFLRGETPVPIVDLFDAMGVFLLSAIIALYLFGLRAQALAAERRIEKQDENLDAIDQPLLDQLKAKLDENKIYQREGLTIAGLADELGIQEYRLRRLINRGLGFRNFNSFINSYRVEEAKEKLADPEFRRIPILTIAMDLGFRSLGPFNRAFREETGMTPSEFRKAKLISQPSS